MIYCYEHPEFFSDLEKPDFSEHSGNLVLWGAGRIGGVAAHTLKKRGVEFIAFCDIAQDKWGTVFCGHMVISPETLKRDYPDAVIIISTIFHDSALTRLLVDGFEKIFDCSSLLMEIDFDGYDFWMEPEYAVRTVRQYLNAFLFRVRKKKYFDAIILTITTKCTLRCRNCDSLIPYINSPRHIDFDMVMVSFSKAINVIGYVDEVSFHGGEPLLHPDLHKMLRSLSAYDDKRIGKIKIITNGTIVPGDDLLNAMKEEKRFSMRISNYKTLSPKIDKIIALLEQNNIKYELTNYEYWDPLPVIEKTDETESELKAKFKNCRVGVLYIYDGKLCVCNPVPFLRELDVIPADDSNYVDLLKEYESPEEAQRKILEYLDRLHEGRYIDACIYCSGGRCMQFERKVPVAEQTSELMKFKKLY